MFYNHLKVAIRNIKKNKLFSALNVLGLAIGIASTIIIMSWVVHEKSWDQSFTDKERIYQVMTHRNFNNELNTNGDMMYPLASALKNSLPEIEYAAVTGNPEERLIALGDKKLRQSSLSISPDFINIFNLEFIEGDAISALNEPGDIILTESTAKALAGSSSMLGKTVLIDNKTSYVVSGIIKDLPARSTMQFSMLLPFDENSPYITKSKTDWVNCFHRTFVKTTVPVTGDKIDEKITDLVESNNPQSKAHFFLHPMEKWHLYSEFKDGKNTGGMIDYVRLFGTVAIIILAIACINFMNLATARSGKRAREVGIRKTIGSGRKQLLAQFLTESLFVSLLSFVVAVVLVYIALPHFNQITGLTLQPVFNNTEFWIWGIGIILVTGFVAGSYPALYLSSFRPVKVLKGVFKPGKEAVQPRKILVTLQFVISILLISATIVVYQQLSHVKNRHFGYRSSDLLLVRSSNDANRNFSAIREDLLKTGFVEDVSRSTSPITSIYNYTAGLEWKGMPPETNLILAAMGCDKDYFRTTGTQIIEGREFTGTTSDSLSLILNQAAVEAMGLQSPVGTQVRYGQKNYTVIGVTENIVMKSPYEPVEPMMTMMSNMRSSHITIRLKEQANAKASVAAIGQVFSRHSPDYPFEYTFADAEFNNKFITEELIGKLINTFAALAIFICCLGLFGLAAFSAEQRTKEIGIRKVLGAEAGGIMMLLSGEFIRLVVIASLIAFPLAWWAMNSWLSNFPYRVAINWWVFGIAGISAIIIALVTVSSQALRAAIANPIKSLRTE